MNLKVIGAGLGRTGTMSLKLALEQLLGGPCYHMIELHRHRDAHTPQWLAAARGEAVDWDGLFDGYVAAVDEPVSLHWRELAARFPEALVVLSLREPQSWWESADATIFRGMRNPPAPGQEAWHAMVLENYRWMYPKGLDDAGACQAFFRRHMEEVRQGVPAERLLEWKVADGWAPLCRALHLPLPEEPFPHVNSTAEFKARKGL